MTEPCNLLITHDAHHAAFARDNARAVLASLGASGPFLEDAPPGVFEVAVPGPVRSTIRAARDLVRRDPPRFAHTHHWRPVDHWVPARLPDMVEAVRRLAPRIGAGDTWRLTVDVHGPSALHGQGLIEPLTAPVRRGQVRLVEPDLVLRVDVLGPRAGVALLARGDELSVDHEQKVLMELPQEV